MIPKTSDDIVCLSEQESHFVKLTKIQAWQELVFVLSAISNIESREKASKLSFWWSDDNLWKNMHCCVYILTYAIDIWCCIELLITLLSVLVIFWCFSINYHRINYRTHQKVTKTLNEVINSSMKHKMSMAYVRIYTQQCIFFHKLSSDHQNDNFEAFSRLSILLIAAKTNTNSCMSSLDFAQFYKCDSCSLKHYNVVKFFWHHLIEETHSYPHVWKFPEYILKYLYGGTFEKCKLFIETHCSYPTNLQSGLSKI